MPNDSIGGRRVGRARTLPHRLTLLALGSALALSSALLAYDLAYHEDITARALASAFTADATRMVTNGNMYVDMAVNTVARNDPFIRRIHFDDRFSFSAHQSLRNEVLGKIGNLGRLDCSKRDDLYAFAAGMGLVFHSIQDYYAHSNHVELVEAYVGSPTLDPTFDDVLRPDPGLEALRDVWLLDASTVIFEALISGAYFVDPPPDIIDSVGNPTHLTHDHLNKDQFRGGGAYLYPDMNRQSLHFTSTWTARKDCEELLARFRSANGGCYATLAGHTFTWSERLFNFVSHSLAQHSSNIIGHWRSGNATVTGDGLAVTIETPTFYPDQPAVRRQAYTYRVANTGSRPIKTLRLTAPAGVLARPPATAPAGWRASLAGGEVVWSADSGHELQPGDAVDLEVHPQDGSMAGYVDLVTGTGRRAEILGPVEPDTMMGVLARAVAILDGRDVDQTMDEFSIPNHARSLPLPPVQPPRSSRLLPLVVGLGLLSFLLLLAVVFLARNRP